ncbi:hypothetical protein [Fervidibacillus albus]|uniref:Protein kinase domain-containing protein n=1 Tax=Fervidibacillus albus TaxID=2980026 RepID=A0A9E8RUS8_9BACI|nr:hypothetical protein [Fervidibacillus albus]WAA08641.1 hypothetical protein OE104_08270 [Fervidibacillus albus]
MVGEKLKEYVNKIEISERNRQDVHVINRSPLKMIGKGRQGAVFQLSNQRCIKVYANEEDCEREYYALQLGQHTNLFPKLFAKGPNYIVMELVSGVDLREYLQSQPLTLELSKKLIEMLITFKEIGYERIDHHKRQIFIQKDGNLKVIDVGRTVWRDRVYPYPRKLINSLGDDYKQIFLSHVQQLAPDLYNEWHHYIEMEKLSSRLTERFLRDHPNETSLKKEVELLLSTNEHPRYEKSLEDLIHKVFDEQWAKVMAAQGYDPEEIEDYIKSISQRDRVSKRKIGKKRSTNYSITHPITTTYRYKRKKSKQKR